MGRLCAWSACRGREDGADVTGWRDRLRRDPGDAGTTLLELMVASGITTVFLGIFTTAVIMVSQTAKRAEAVTGGGSDVAIAFQRLDRSVRYASEIQAPGQAGGAWWVEYLTTSSGSKVCTQLSLDPATRQLRSRTWTPAAAGTTPAPSGWTTLVGRVSNGAATGAAAPFVRPVPAASSGIGYQQLVVQLVSSVGNPPSASASQTTFTALNSAAAAKALASGTEPTTCTQVARQ